MSDQRNNAGDAANALARGDKHGDEHGDAHGEDDSDVLTFLVRHTWLGLRAAVGDELVAFGLSVPQFATLKMLDGQPGLSIAQVARKVGSTRQAANEMVAGLEQQGLVTRAPHPTDRRTQCLELTAEGRARYRAARPAVRRREAELEAGFTVAQRAAAREWMRGIATACSDG
jgi:DNA-binding MarR family transcriptional regulator